MLIPKLSLASRRLSLYYARLSKRELTRLGANLRRERVERAITQEKQAEMVDLNIRTLQKIEAGQTHILLTTVLRLQRALGCSWGKLMPARGNFSERAR